MRAPQVPRKEVEIASRLRRIECEELVFMVVALTFEKPLGREAVVDRAHLPQGGEDRSKRAAGLTRFAHNPSEALSRSLAVIGRELRLEHDHDAGCCGEHAEWAEGLLRDYEQYLDRLATPRDESWPKLLSVAVELLAVNDRIIGEIRRSVIEPLKKTSRRRSRSGIRKDFLGYHRTLRDCRRRLDAAWREIGSTSEHLPDYFGELERGSPWRDAVLAEPTDSLRACVESFEHELRGPRDVAELCRISRRIRYVAERLDNCRAVDGTLVQHACSLFAQAEVKLTTGTEETQKYIDNIAHRRHVLTSMLEASVLN